MRSRLAILVLSLGIAACAGSGPSPEAETYLREALALMREHSMSWAIDTASSS